MTFVGAGEAGDAGADYLADFEATEQRADADAVAGELEQALGTLPAELRRALELRVVEGLSYEELAYEEGISGTNARMRVSRALRSMAVRLTE